MLWVRRRFVEKVQPGEIKAFKVIDGKDTEVPIGTEYSVTRTWIPGDRNDNKYVGDQYEAMLHQLTPEDYNALALGLWEIPDQQNQLVKGVWWDFACSGEVQPLGNLADERFSIGGDFAHQGQDKSVLITGKGNKVIQIKQWPKNTTEEFAYEVYLETRKRGFFTTEVGIDCIGPGVGVGDMLTIDSTTTIKGRAAPVEIKAIPKLFKAVHKDEHFETKWKYGYKFANLRSQMWWQFAQDMENGQVDLSWLASAQCGFTDVSKIKEEVLAHTFEIRNGVIYVISKNELRDPDKGIGRSPDFADALVLWNWVRPRTVDVSTSAAKEIRGVDGYMKDFFTQSELDQDQYSMETEKTFI